MSDTDPTPFGPLEEQVMRLRNESDEFVRRLAATQTALTAARKAEKVQNENGGPNAKILEMRKRYDEVNRAKSPNNSPRPDNDCQRTTCEDGQLTVHELIEQLQKLPQDARVWCYSYDEDSAVTTVRIVPEKFDNANSGDVIIS